MATTQRVAIDCDYIDDAALGWWRSLSPSTRAVFIQALWETEDQPEKARDNQRPRRNRAAALSTEEARP